MSWITINNYLWEAAMPNQSVCQTQNHRFKSSNLQRSCLKFYLLVIGWKFKAMGG